MSEAKIEPWMVAAGMTISSAYVKYQQLPLYDITEIIARHAPDPASVPIGPGDVVQVVEDYMPPGSYPKLMFRKDYCFVVSDIGAEDGKSWASYSPVGCRIPINVLTRIGRAVYWPDGSKVEEGGK
jgi:hypothetical protein